jgi:type III restriction enzyme
MAREDFLGWLRNREKQPWALCIPYKQTGVWKGCYPDFLVFRRNGGDVIVDIIDPHLTSMEDSPLKAAALAWFAKPEWERQTHRRSRLQAEEP